MFFFFFNKPAPTDISPLPPPDALPLKGSLSRNRRDGRHLADDRTALCRQHALRDGNGLLRRFSFGEHHFRHAFADRSEEHTSELQSRQYLVCRLLLEKKK